MPRHVRNFWVRAQIDGKKTVLAGGPKAKDGGFSLTVSQRDEGSVRQVVTIEGEARDGLLTLRVWTNDGGFVPARLVETVTTRREPTKRLRLPKSAAA